MGKKERDRTKISRKWDTDKGARKSETYKKTKGDK